MWNYPLILLLKNKGKKHLKNRVCDYVAYLKKKKNMTQKYISSHDFFFQKISYNSNYITYIYISFMIIDERNLVLSFNICTCLQTCKIFNINRPEV